LDKYQKALKGGPVCPQQAFQEPESVLAVGLSMESGGGGSVLQTNHLEPGLWLVAFVSPYVKPK